MRISDLSSDVCSSDLMLSVVPGFSAAMARSLLAAHGSLASVAAAAPEGLRHHPGIGRVRATRLAEALHGEFVAPVDRDPEPARPSRTERARSEEHTSELQSLMRISYAVFCLNKKKKITNPDSTPNNK